MKRAAALVFWFLVFGSLPAAVVLGHEAGDAEAQLWLFSVSVGTVLLFGIWNDG